MSKAITRIYKGPIRKLMVTEAIRKTDGTFSLKIPEPEQAEIIKNDAEFYINWFGSQISLDYNTKLPDYNEARTYVENIAKTNPELASCIYVNDQEIHYSHIIENDELKVLKKIHKK